MDAVQPPAPEPVLDGASTEARAELPVRDAAMLPLGQLGNQRIHDTHLQKPMYVMGKCRCV
jgi:hypothetical protein